MPDPERLKADAEGILESGINHTGRFIELMMEKGWSNDTVVPLVYQLLLAGRLDPKGNKDPD